MLRLFAKRRGPTAMGGGGDTEAPTVAITTASSGNADPIVFTVTFSEEVTGFAIGDIFATGCTLSNFATADNIVFTVDATPTQRAITVDINADVCTDLAGNGNTAATQATFTSTWFPTDIPTSEGQALKDLYGETGGASWTNKTNWGTDAAADNWYGVTVSGGRVTQLILNSNNLNGVISAFDVGDFPNLTTLHLFSNASLSGSVGGWTLPSSLVDFRINSTAVSGDIGSWALPSSLSTFRVNTSAVSGDISGWTLPSSLVNFYISSTSVSGDISGWTLPSSLQNFTINSTSVSGDISSWVLPSSLSGLTANSTSVSGDISGWTLPSVLVSFYLYNTSVSGDISSWVLPSALVNFYIYGTSVSGVPDCTGAVALTNFQIHNCGLSQASVDGILWSIYQISRTASNGTVNVGGTNAAPSGTYQAAASCPVTGSTPGKEVAHELLNDGCGAGINTWATVTFTA